jgi:hypothetical protein
MENKKTIIYATLVPTPVAYADDLIGISGGRALAGLAHLLRGRGGVEEWRREREREGERGRERDGEGESGREKER